MGRAVIAFSAYLEIINLGIRLRNLVGDYNHILLVLWKERIELLFFFFFLSCVMSGSMKSLTRWRNAC